MIAVSPEQSEELEARGIRNADQDLVIGPYLVEVSLENGAPEPRSRREQIRASGAPTIPVGAGTEILTAA